MSEKSDIKQLMEFPEVFSNSTKNVTTQERKCKERIMSEMCICTDFDIIAKIFAALSKQHQCDLVLIVSAIR